MSDENAPGLVLTIPAGLKPVYVNVARIGHSPMELTLDFACMMPGVPVHEIQARLLMSPVGAKLFLQALAENLARYEAAFGEVHLPGDPSLATDLFRGVRSPGE